MTFNGSLNGGKRSHTFGGGEGERGHMCARCMNPYTRAGNTECVNAPAAEFPESPYGDDLADMDDPAYRAARFESDALDAAIDRMREERHFGF